jgi:hypothetical protein
MSLSEMTRMIGSTELTTSKRLRKEFVTQIVAFFLLATSIVLLWRDNVPLFIVVLDGSIIALSLWHDRYDLCFFIVIAGIGWLAETFFVHFGVWQYANPTFMGVPMWFPLAFGTAALISGRLVRTITQIWEKAFSRSPPKDRLAPAINSFMPTLDQSSGGKKNEKERNNHRKPDKKV